MVVVSSAALSLSSILLARVDLQRDKHSDDPQIPRQTSAESAIIAFQSYLKLVIVLTKKN